MSEKSINLLEIITGALMIAAPLFGCWVRYEPGDALSIAFWEWRIFDEIQVWQTFLLVAGSIVLFAGGALYILNAIKLLKPWPFIRFILLCAGFAGILISTIGIMIDYELEIFEFTADGFVGLGPGLFLGIAAVAFGVILLLKDSQTNT
ncbi:MAG: hypothetical protein LUQ65_00760 [Candidatus Helarchaeota archaeon]|nr:hypothetical protein [Candidatus Helarchaeota archaeon]